MNYTYIKGETFLFPKQRSYVTFNNLTSIFFNKFPNTHAFLTLRLQDLLKDKGRKNSNILKTILSQSNS